MSGHFCVGDTVTYRDGTTGVSLICQVVRVMPVERCGAYYRIRDLSERFERSVSADTLTPIAAAPSDGTLQLDEGASS